jgi:hypothetical protein
MTTSFLTFRVLIDMFILALKAGVTSIAGLSALFDSPPTQMESQEKQILAILERVSLYPM